VCPGGASAIKEVVQSGFEVKVMMDGGPENKNNRVLKFIVSANMKRVIARADIRFSNSMFEAFFRSLKHNFLIYQKFMTLRDLERKLRFFFKQYNQIMPHSAFAGATPKEMFHGIWTEKSQEKIKNEMRNAFSHRRQIKRIISCGVFKKV
jgi:hypothetical protein